MSTGSSDWICAGSLSALQRKGRRVHRHGAKQIALFWTGDRVLACNNRCPHEGYPLSEGSLSADCQLTCNWHNWKFDLGTGANAMDGDRLRVYPAELRDGEIWLDVADPPADRRIAEALSNLRSTFARHEYDRMAREIGRLRLAGGDPLEAIRQAIVWTHEQFEFGMGHAHAAAADWLDLHARLAPDSPESLIPLVEIAGHLAWDTMREPAFAYPGGIAAFDEDGFVAAIEREDEAAAAAMVRGAARDGLAFADVERGLARGALAHYQGFGHAAIYTLKTGRLIEILGREVFEPLLLALTRMIVFARREDLIPEYRQYATRLADWSGTGNGAPLAPEDFHGASINRAMARVAEGAREPEAAFGVLLAASAWHMLHYDTAWQDQTEGRIADNIGWLDFTHSITFANAVRQLCGRYPDLWPAALLQMACFIGRNARYIDAGLDETRWRIDDADAFFAAREAQLLDHGEPEYIFACHWLKTLAAGRAEYEADPDGPAAPLLLAALNRLFETPMKRKHMRRIANQALDFVAGEG